MTLPFRRNPFASRLIPFFFASFRNWSRWLSEPVANSNAAPSRSWLATCTVSSPNLSCDVSGTSFSATSAKSETSSEPRRRSPATVIDFKPRLELSKFALAVANRSAARWMCLAPSEFRLASNPARILRCSAGPKPLYAFQPVLLGSDLKFVNRVDTELFM